MSIIDAIEAYDLPLNSAAVQKFNSDAREGKYNGSMGMVLRNILNIDVPAMHEIDSTVPEDHSRVQVAYVIDGAIRAHKEGREITPSDLYTTATEKTRAFVQELSWVFAKKEEDKLDSEGKPKQKKGAKQLQAYEVYVQFVETDRSRKDIIQAFQDVVGMTKAGATTYYYNMKKKYEAAN